MPALRPILPIRATSANGRKGADCDGPAPRPERRLYDQLEDGRRSGRLLGEWVVGAGQVIISGHEDDGMVRIGRPDARRQLATVHPRHHEID